MSSAGLKKTREEILDVAWTLVSAEGVDISLAEIANAAGVSRQALYLHFSSRGGLLMALVERADEQFKIEEKFGALQKVQSPDKRLEKAILLWLDFVVYIHPVATDLIRLRATDDAAAAAWSSRMDKLKHGLRTLTGSLKKDGILRKDWSSRKAADYLWASTSLQLWSLLTQECGWSQGEVRKTLCNTLTATLLEQTPRPKL